MRKRLKLLLLPCLILGAGIFLSAEEQTLTLDKALVIARENSLSLYTANKSLDTASADYRARFNVLYPAVSATGTLKRTTTSLPETDTTGLNAGLSASITLNPALSDGIKYLRQAYASAGLDREKAEKALERDVKVSFYNLLYMEGTIQLNKESMKTLKSEYDLALADYRNGRISELELLKTEVAYKNMEPVIASLTTSYREQRSRFFLLLGIEDDRNLQLEGAIELPADLKSLTPVDVDLAGQFDIAALDNTIAETKINLASTQHSGLAPSLILSAACTESVSAPLRSTTWEGGFDAPWSHTSTLSLTFSLPVDDWLPGSSTRTEIAGLKRNLEVLKKKRSRTFQSAVAEVNLLFDNLNDALLNIESLQLNLKVAERAYELTQDGYRKGTQEFLALQEAEDDLNTARQNLLEKKLDFLTSLFDLEYTLNTSTDEILSKETK